MSIRLSTVSSFSGRGGHRMWPRDWSSDVCSSDLLTPVIAGATPSLMLVAIVKLLLKFRAGLKVTPASKALTSAMAPLALHTPGSAEHTSELQSRGQLVCRLPPENDRVRVAVMLALST